MTELIGGYAVAMGREQAAGEDEVGINRGDVEKGACQILAEELAKNNFEFGVDN